MLYMMICVMMYDNKIDIDPLKTTILLNCIYKFSSYLTGNTLRHRYKDQPVNAV
jgi:hypothetical protein